MTTDSDAGDQSQLSTGGGQATQAGVSFQARLSAYFAALGLGERSLAVIGLPNSKIASIRVETEAPVDDILLTTEEQGYVAIQAKTTISMSAAPGSAMASVAGQIVRFWLAASSGSGSLGWDRCPDAARDRLVLAVGPSTGLPVRAHLADALNEFRGNVPMHTQPSNRRSALEQFIGLVKAAWVDAAGIEPPQTDVDSLLRLFCVVTFDTDAAHRLLAEEALRDVIVDPDKASDAYTALVDLFMTFGRLRTGGDLPRIRLALSELRTAAGESVALLPPPGFRTDIQRLKQRSERVRCRLEGFESLKFRGRPLHISRPCTDSLVALAEEGSTLVIGEPGVGKSGVLSETASRLRTAGHDVVELAVDELKVSNMAELDRELQLTSSLEDVLANWGGARRGFLVIDALDASRGGVTESVFRVLIERVLASSGMQWTVIASIRTFDLRQGEKLRRLFAGQPAADGMCDKSFHNVRHLLVAPWTEAEVSVLISQAPELQAALAGCTPKVRNLASVPFNMKLIAELVESEAIQPLCTVQSQSQLLAVYWQSRVDTVGEPLEIFLADVVSKMIETRSLKLERLLAARIDADQYRNAVGNGILTLLDNERYIGYRHHVLFDYAVSRLFLNPFELDELRGKLARDNDYGLLLGPSVGFMLQSVWHQDAERYAFWILVISLLRDSQIDPISRTVVSRIASELPSDTPDIVGLGRVLREIGSTDLSGVQRALGDIVGAFGVAFEESSSTISLSVWVKLCSVLAECPSLAPGILRVLLLRLVGFPPASAFLSELGVASRVLFNYALDQSQSASSLVVAAINLVCDTYSSDRDSSRACLQRLLEPERMVLHAHTEIPWLARKVANFINADPTFAVQIYGAVFGHDVTSDERTHISPSQVLSLSSTARQDYGMAKYSLKEAMPSFLETEPAQATRAVVRALEAHQRATSAADESVAQNAIICGSREVRLNTDWNSYSSIDFERPSYGDIGGILRAFAEAIAKSRRDKCVSASDEVVAINELAVVWAALFDGLARRVDNLGEDYWEIARNVAFLFGSGTQKHAVRLLSRFYANRSIGERQAFEEETLRHDFSGYNDPPTARAYILRGIFGTIGKSSLVSAEAVELAEEAPHQNADIRATWSPTEVVSSTLGRWEYLRGTGVQVNEPETATLLALADEVAKEIDTDAGSKQLSANDVVELQPRVTGLLDSIRKARQASVHPVAVAAAEDVLARACQRLLSVRAKRGSDISEQRQTLRAIVVTLCNSKSPEGGPEEEARFEKFQGYAVGARVPAAATLLQELATSSAIDDGDRALLKQLVGDNHPAVRAEVAQHLTSIWRSDKQLMWELAKNIATQESNFGVLQLFAGNFLSNVLDADPACSEVLVTELVSRVSTQDEPHTELLSLLASSLAVLWCGHGRPASHAVLHRWLGQISTYKGPLGQASFTVRDFLIVGQSGQDPQKGTVRLRTHEFFLDIAKATGSVLTGHYRDVQTGSVESQDVPTLQASAELLDQVMSQLYFVSGAFISRGHAEGLKSISEKSRFLEEASETLGYVADAGHSKSIHQLIELLKFLLPAEPALTFDLVTRALLGAGRLQGYQADGMAIDSVVKFVGEALADYPQIFAQSDRRRRLIDCLELFSEVGWPAARRLLYQVSEALK
ncbi:hypothetical protein [Paraburkholderia sp. 40]|uniref:hypothetical protein n=1 Tax=Paraburkholderia sp. 40 TaxID=2991059 RepID=UPI003D2327F0